MNEDTIRRSDAIKAIEDISKNYTGKGKSDYHPHIDFLVDALKYDVPTIEPKRGEWIGEADGYYNGELIYDTWYCSNCDYVVDDEEPPTWNFCPNCGTRMKGADDER